MDNDGENTALQRYPKMSQEQLDRIFLIIARAGRSPCFWWFYDHYDGMQTAEGKLRMTWRECCASLTELGITALHGRPLTPETARRTWKKVVEKKRRDAARKVQCPATAIELDTVH